MNLIVIRALFFIIFASSVVIAPLQTYSDSDSTEPLENSNGTGTTKGPEVEVVTAAVKETTTPKPSAGEVDEEEEEEEDERNWFPQSDEGTTIRVPENLSELSDTRFVVVHTLRTGKEVEMPFRFRGGPKPEPGPEQSPGPSPKVSEVNSGDDNESETNARIPRANNPPNKENSTPATEKTSPNTTALTTTTLAEEEEEKEKGPPPPPLPVQNQTFRHGTKLCIGGTCSRIDLDVIKNFTRLLPSQKSTLVIFQYTHQLTAVERAGDTNAKIGSNCTARTILDHDYCERASFPNKNKMFCMNANDPKIGIKRNTCACKFYRTTEAGGTWKQMKETGFYLNLNWVQACLVPPFGVCNHRVNTGLQDKEGKPIYEVDVCQGHFQCDNSKYFNDESVIRRLDGTPYAGVLFDQNKHCDEEEFLNQFVKKVRRHILTCSKPNPSRFSEYNEYKYYCLPESARDKGMKHFKAAQSEHPPGADEVDEI